MRLDGDAGEPRCLWSNSGNDREKVKIRMSAPSMRIRSCGLWLFRPGRKPKCDHVPPRLQEVQITVSHSCVVECAHQIKSEVVSCFCHIRDGPRCCKTRITDPENFSENILLFFRRDYVKPHAENVSVLAVMRFGWSIRD